MQIKYILKTMTLYGIAIKTNNGGESKPIFILDKSKKDVSEFIKLCNTEGLEPIHLKDAIDDILCPQKSY